MVFRRYDVRQKPHFIINMDMFQATVLTQYINVRVACESIDQFLCSFFLLLFYWEFLAEAWAAMVIAG